MIHSCGWVEIGGEKVLVVAPLADAPTPAKRSAPLRQRSQVEIRGGTYRAEQTGGNAGWVLSRCAPVIALVAARKGLLPVGRTPCHRHRRLMGNWRPSAERPMSEQCSRNIAMIPDRHFR